jgi:hypothetical protein
MEELERLLDAAQSIKSEDGKRSRYLSALHKLNDPETDPNKRYINPEAKIKLSRFEKERLIKLGRYNDESLYAKELANNIRNQKEFSYKQILNYTTDLKREGGRFDDSLYQIAARTAATEVAVAYGLGRLQVYIERGVQYVQWIATMDAKTSVFCQSLHRKIFAVRDLIPAAMAKQTFPKTRLPEYAPENNNIKNMLGINVWSTPAHPWCRSFLSPIYTDEQKIGDKYPPKGFPPDADLNKYLLADLIERKELFKGLSPKQREAYLQEIVESQNNMRESKTKKLLRSMGNLQDMFNSGLSYLTRRLKQDKVANFTVDELRRNDSQLATALIGGAAVLGTGAMMYFFMKSNLAQTLQEYIKTNVGNLVVGSLGPEAIKRLLNNLIKTSKEVDNLPDSVKELMASEIDLNDVSMGDKINSINSLGEVAYEMASLGNFKDIENLVSSRQVVGLTNQAPKAIATRAGYNRLLQKRAELSSRINDIMANAIRNKGGSIQPSDIIRISEWPNNYAIVVRGKGNTFVSKKIFDEMMENPIVRSEIDQLSEEIEKFDRASRGIEEYDGGDIISDSVKTADRLEYLRLKGNLRALSDRVLNRDVIKPNVDLPQNLPEVNSILNQAIEVEANYSRALDTLYNDFKSVLPSQNLLTGFIPETINSIEELRAIQKIVKDSLAEVRRDFLTKGKSYTPGTAARKRNLDIDLNKTLLDLENLERRLESNGLQYNASVVELNANYQNKINSDLSLILDLDARINNRIKEISN